MQRLPRTVVFGLLLALGALPADGQWFRSEDINRPLACRKKFHRPDAISASFHSASFHSSPSNVSMLTLKG